MKKSTFSNATNATSKLLNKYQYLDWDVMYSQKYVKCPELSGVRSYPHLPYSTTTYILWLTVLNTKRETHCDNVWKVGHDTMIVTLFDSIQLTDALTSEVIKTRTITSSHYRKSAPQKITCALASCSISN